jgi:hypothetical protein
MRKGPVFIAVAEAVTSLASLILLSLVGQLLPGTLIDSATVTLYLAWLGFPGEFTGILLWPAVILTGLLTWELNSSPKDIPH